MAKIDSKHLYQLIEEAKTLKSNIEESATNPPISTGLIIKWINHTLEVLIKIAEKLEEFSQRIDLIEGKF